MVSALRATGPGSERVRAVSAAPDLDGWALVERLLKDLAPQEQRLWLVVDDVHELGHEALRQLELLIMRARPQLNDPVVPVRGSRATPDGRGPGPALPAGLEGRGHPVVDFALTAPGWVATRPARASQGWESP